jgi:hypothetical protein
MPEQLTESPSRFALILEDIKKRPSAYVRVRQAAEAFVQLTDPTPGDYSDYWRERWEAFGTIVGSEITVPSCDRSHSEIQELHEKGRVLVFRPKDLTLPQLGEMHPNMRSWSIRPDTAVESDPRFGWLDIADVTYDTYLDTDVDDLEDIARKTGRSGMTLETYIIGSHDHFDRTGEYFDHGSQTTSKLLGSRLDGYVLFASFNSDGYLNVFSDWGIVRSMHLGGRFEGMK